MWIDGVWVCELFIVVFLTSFSLYVTYLFPIQYCDLLHRSASHLGHWEKIEKCVTTGPATSTNALSSSANIYPPTYVWYHRLKFYWHFLFI